MEYLVALALVPLAIAICWLAFCLRVIRTHTARDAARILRAAAEPLRRRPK